MSSPDNHIQDNELKKVTDIYIDMTGAMTRQVQGGNSIASIDKLLTQVPPIILKSKTFDEAIAALIENVPFANRVEIFHAFSDKLSECGPAVMKVLVSIVSDT